MALLVDCSTPLHHSDIGKESHKGIPSPSSEAEVSSICITPSSSCTSSLSTSDWLTLYAIYSRSDASGAKQVLPALPPPPHLRNAADCTAYLRDLPGGIICLQKAKEFSKAIEASHPLDQVPFFSCICLVQYFVCFIATILCW